MKEVIRILENKVYLAVFVLVTVLSFIIFIYLPVKTIPGNDFIFQLSILSFKDLVLLVILSLLIGFSFSLQLALWGKNHKLRSNLKGIGSMGVGSLSGVVAAIFGTASCASCLTALFGFLGIGIVFALIDYRVYIVLGSIVLILISILLTARQLNKNCSHCKT